MSRIIVTCSDKASVVVSAAGTAQRLGLEDAINFTCDLGIVWGQMIHEHAERVRVRIGALSVEVTRTELAQSILTLTRDIIKQGEVGFVDGWHDPGAAKILIALKTGAANIKEAESLQQIGETLLSEAMRALDQAGYAYEPVKEEAAKHTTLGPSNASKKWWKFWR